MVVPAMPRVSDGTVRNWSPLATGTVRMGMSWALRGEKVRREAIRTAMGAGMRCWGLLVVFRDIFPDHFLDDGISPRMSRGVHPESDREARFVTDDRRGVKAEQTSPGSTARRYHPPTTRTAAGARM